MKQTNGLRLPRPDFPARTRFQREPDFGVTSLTYDLPELLARDDPC